MNIMQAVLGQMQEERVDRPEDDREDGQPSWQDRSWNSEQPSSQDHSGGQSQEHSDKNEDEPTGSSANEHPELLSDAVQEASNRRSNRPNQNAPGGLHSFMDKRKPRPPVAAGLASEALEEPSDEALFLQYQQGDDQAFFFIYERYKSSIYAYCAQVLFSVGMTRESVEDTFQDVFFRLVQYRHTFNGGDFRPWIFTVTRHSCLSAKKRSFRDHDGQEYSGDGVNLEGASDEVRMAFSSNDDPLERMSMNEQTGLLLAAIAKLPDEFREALILSEYEGLTYDEIGRMMGASLSTIRIRIFRAKARLRKMLLPVIGDDAGMNTPGDTDDRSSHTPPGKKKN
jgi:RNA polymerase sigma factor (sigma-70 family)